MTSHDTDAFSQFTNFNIMESLTSINNTLVPILLYYVLPFLILAIFSWSYYMNKKVWRFPITIFRRRSNGQVIRFETKGGYIKDRKGLTSFKIRLGRVKKHELDYLPDTNLMDASDGRLYFNQLDPETFIQTKAYWMKVPLPTAEVEFSKNFSVYKQGEKAVLPYGSAMEMERTGLLQITKEMNTQMVDAPFYEPVPRDTKAMAIQRIRDLSNTLDINTTKQMAIVAGGMFLMFLTAAVLYYLLTNRA